MRPYIQSQSCLFPSAFGKCVTSVTVACLLALVVVVYSPSQIHLPGSSGLEAERGMKDGGGAVDGRRRLLFEVR